MMSLPKAVGIVATLAATAVTSAFNYRFFSGLSVDATNAALLGWGSVALDVFKAALPVLVVIAVADRAWLRAAAGCLLFAVLFVSGSLSAMGFASETRSGLVGSRANMAAALADVRRDEAEARRRLAAIPAFRPAATVAAEIAALKRERAWESSRQCADATAAASRELCARIERLSGERAMAAEAAVLEAKAERLQGEIGRLVARGAGVEADPQANAVQALLRRMVGRVELSDVRSGLSAFWALAFELVSSFGLVLSGVGHRRAVNEAQPLAPVAPGGEVVLPGHAPPAETLQVSDWALARVHFTGGRLALREAFADYLAQAALQGLHAVDEAAFGAELARVCGKIDIAIEDGALQGLGLVMPDETADAAGS